VAIVAISQSETITKEVLTVERSMKDLATNWAAVPPGAKLVWIQMAQKSLARLRRLVKAESKIIKPKEG
jgi:hypothetical protein